MTSQMSTVTRSRSRVNLTDEEALSVLPVGAFSGGGVCCATAAVINAVIRTNATRCRSIYPPLAVHTTLWRGLLEYVCDEAEKYYGHLTAYSARAHDSFKEQEGHMSAKWLRTPVVLAAIVSGVSAVVVALISGLLGGNGSPNESTTPRRHLRSPTRLSRRRPWSTWTHTPRELPPLRTIRRCRRGNDRGTTGAARCRSGAHHRSNVTRPIYFDIGSRRPHALWPSATRDLPTGE